MTLIERILVLLLAGLLSVPVCAQGYPSKPITLIIPFAPGGSGDAIGRLVGAKLTEAWGQQFLLEHRPGASGLVGYNIAKARAADGYTLMLGTDTQIVTLPYFVPGLGYYDKDFDPVVRGVTIQYILAANPSIPANTVPELVAYLKANRGKHNYAHSGVGSVHHLSMELFKSVVGLDVQDLVGVAYKGSGQYMVDLVAGQVQLAYQGIPQTMPHVRSGKLKAMAVGAAERLDSAPGVPAIAESYPGFETTASWNYFAPAGTPRDIVLKLNAAINAALAMPDVRERLVAQGLYPIGGTPADLTARMKSDYEKWGALIRKLNLKPE
jgi:tripartite-type tricarboxylate transporter receptor subunit TctC